MTETYLIFKKSDIDELSESAKEELQKIPHAKHGDVFLIGYGHPLYEALSQAELERELYLEAKATVDSWMGAQQ